jgi:hypothetical protein
MVIVTITVCYRVSSLGEGGDFSAARQASRNSRLASLNNFSRDIL